MNGRVWKVGADIDTDQLAPGAWMKHGVDVIAQHCLESIRPDFPRHVKPGDVLAAGPNFGIGSSREQAASVLVHLGLAAVIAPSYNGLFFRNAFNVGLLLLTCPESEKLEEGERVSVDTQLGSVRKANGEALVCAPIPGLLLEMVRAGGLFAQLKRQIAESKLKEN